MNDIVQTIRSKLDHAAAKKVLREKYQAKLTFAHNGGMFSTTPEMIVFLSIYGDQRIVIKDLYDNPVEVNAGELYGLMRSRYQEQMNAWLVEYADLQRQR